MMSWKNFKYGFFWYLKTVPPGAVWWFNTSDPLLYSGDYKTFLYTAFCNGLWPSLGANTSCSDKFKLEPPEQTWRSELCECPGLPPPCSPPVTLWGHRLVQPSVDSSACQLNQSSPGEFLASSVQELLAKGKLALCWGGKRHTYLHHSLEHPMKRPMLSSAE